MTWQPYESRGIAAIDAALAEKLNSYLENKESQLGAQLIGAIHFFHETPPILKPNLRGFRLHEAVEEFGKMVHRVFQIQQPLISINEWELSAKQIEKSLWSYVEILEGCVTELFQQLDQISFENWNADLLHAVDLIKDNLMHRMEDLIWAIRRLERQLLEFQWICKVRNGKWVAWQKLFFLSHRVFDRSLEATVLKCQKFLGFRYQKFHEKYIGYIQLHDNADQSLEKFSNYQTFAAMDSDFQDKFQKLYLLLRLWELNRSAKTLPQNEIIRAVRTSVSSEGAFSLFREYFSVLRKAFFDKSRMIKMKFHDVFQDVQARKPLIDTTAGYRTELHLLGATTAKYRDFLLRSDPDPYIRSRWGFTESIVGPEPKYSKQLQGLMYQIEHMDALCAAFHTSMENENAMERRLTPEVEQEIASHLHEMGQPLASKPIMHSHADSILLLLKQLDELASFHPDVVEYICTVFCKAMRADWKYNVLQEIPLFHQLYEIHQDIVAPLEDRQHHNRLHKFRQILEQLEQWVKHGDTLKHAHEIELDVNDIKAYLQDFYANVQGIKPFNDQPDQQEGRLGISKVNQALLEYRYLFSKFFHNLRSDVLEERLIRKQFLFVDQYLEAIENKIQELTI